MNIKQFVKKRDEALLSMDKDKILSFLKETGVKIIPTDERVFWAGIHKARVEVINFSEDVKNESRKWLIENGFQPGLI